MAYRPSQRTFEDVESNERFRLYVNTETDTYRLVSDGSEKFAGGTEVNGFYIASHTPTQIKLNTKKVISLNSGQFYTLKEGEVVTHRKFCGFNRFSKV